MKLQDYKSVLDLKGMTNSELTELAQEVRQEIYDECMRFEGHLGSNMAIVDLTVSLLKHFGYENYRYLFDTGYQANAFKRLTDRQDFYSNVHTPDGYNVFQELEEGDPYSGGHTSISAGWASGYNWLNDGQTTIEIIGDGSLATPVGMGGLLNFGVSKHKGLFILNDNKQGIGINQFNYLDWQKITTGMGFAYYEVRDGHDYDQLEAAWQFFDNAVGPVFVKVNTIKGYSLKDIPNPEQVLHYVNPNAKPTPGFISPNKWLATEFYPTLFEKNKDAMLFLSGMVWTFGLDKLWKKHPEQIIDAGIAEEISIVQAAAASIAGKEAYFAVVSSFFQRCYDQIIHDIMRNNINVTILVSETNQQNIGDSHHGLYDLNMYNGFENIHIYHPVSTGDLKQALEESKLYNGPKIIRCNSLIIDGPALAKKETEWVYEVNNNAKQVIISYGEAYLELKKYIANNKVVVDLVLANTLNPIDDKLIKELIASNKRIYTYEYTFWKNNLASTIRAHYPDQIVKDYSFKNTVIGRWGMPGIMKNNKMDVESVIEEILATN